jgi:transcriptional regulator GlxA family with amidase domain
MNRRQLLAGAAVAGAAAAAPGAVALSGRGSTRALPERPLQIPAGGSVRVAFAIGDGFNVIDLAGSWEVFQDAAVAHAAAWFELYSVGPHRSSTTGSGGLVVTPTYTYDDAPQPNVVVIPAHQALPITHEWLRHVAPRTNLIMSVCTGAFVLAETGLLDGLTATTHHGSYDDFARMFPKVELVRNARFVEHDRVASAGGLTSGIDLSLRVVERYLGRDATERTASYMEYESRRWTGQSTGVQAWT